MAKTVGGGNRSCVSRLLLQIPTDSSELKTSRCIRRQERPFEASTDDIRIAFCAC
jgi:hypothetical protein